MKITSILLLAFILLLSCKKDSGIPDKYSFLLGEWHCYNCPDETNVTIKKNYLKVITTGDRGGIVRYRDLEVNEYNDFRLNSKFKNFSIVFFQKPTNFIYIDLDQNDTPYNYPRHLNLKKK